MRKFSVRPVLTLRGRTFKGLRGWSGKALHPPLTDIPVTAYLLAAVLDVISATAGKDLTWARAVACRHVYLHRRSGRVSPGGPHRVVGCLEVVRGGDEARRTINTHATIMIIVTVLASADIVWRLADYHTEPVTPAGVAVLSAVIAGLVSIGATFGGSLVFEYGFNVETAGDSPVWHKSEDDVFPGQHA